MSETIGRICPETPGELPLIADQGLPMDMDYIMYLTRAAHELAITEVLPPYIVNYAENTSNAIDGTRLPVGFFRIVVTGGWLENIEPTLVPLYDRAEEIEFEIGWQEPVAFEL